MALVLISATFWAVNGNIGSYLYANKEITPGHLTMFRLLISGLLLLSHQYITNKDQMFDIFQNKRDLGRLLYFAFFGILTMQYTYLSAIKHSNAATATILQSLAPFIIIIISAIMYKSLPSLAITFASILGFIGAFLLITHGRLDQLAITTLTLVFGLITALGTVNYNLAPGKLQKKYSTVLIIGWSMFMAGIVFSLVFRPWTTLFIVDWASILGITYVGIFGTAIPFLLYLSGSKMIGPQKASILNLAEPVMATIIGVLFLKEHFLTIDYVGMGLVVLGLYLLSKPERPSNSSQSCT